MVALTAIHVVFLIIGVLRCNVFIKLIIYYENCADLYRRDLAIATGVTVVVHLMGNHFQINLVPKSIMINNVSIIKFVDRRTIRYIE